MSKKFLRELDKVFDSFQDTLKQYGKSDILFEAFYGKFVSFFYGNLISNFFSNLTQENVVEYNLPKGKISIIKKKYTSFRKDVNSALTASKFERVIDEKYYKAFKARLRKYFPAFFKIVEFIEKEVDYRNAKNYLNEKRKLLKASRKETLAFNDIFMTQIVEGFIKHKKCLPSQTVLSKISRKLIQDFVFSSSEGIMKHLRKTSDAMLKEQKKTNEYYDKRRYERWKIPIDLFECLIRVSFESGEAHRYKLLKNLVCKSYPYKLDALVKIHARAIQTANEILVLLKAGYPDGANARWRCLHELAVISFFLKDSRDEVSRRYLEHDFIKRYKEAQDYKTYYSKLGYAPLGKKTYSDLARIKRKLYSKYNDRFQDEYGWIPSSILCDRNFRALEKHVKLDSLHPFYNLSCGAIHGGARGFYRMGMMEQDKALLVGASNYGLADPLQNSSVSLGHITVCLLNLEPDFESLTQMQILRKYIVDIANQSVEVQRKIERDEKLLKKRQKR